MVESLNQQSPFQPIGIMRRRDFFISIAGTVATWPTSAQEPRGTLHLGWLARGQVPSSSRAFLDTLRRLGWVEGRNLVIERRFADSEESYHNAAAELVGAGPDVLFGAGAPDVAALLAETHSIPIVFAATSDPVALGLVESLARPGGNVTGVSTMTPELEVKQLELLRELLPEARRVAMLRDAGNPGSESRLAVDLNSAPSLGLTLVRRPIRSSADIESAFSATAADRDDAVHVEFSGATLIERDHIVALASRYRLPAIYGVRPYAEAGGLLAYGPIYAENFKRVAILVDKIFRGAKPDELPVEEPTRFELVINAKSATKLGLTVPLSLLTRADEVIE
jgi:putative ABC transport system substrate-binding protein